MIRFFYAPDVSVSSGGQLVEDTKAKSSKGYAPGSDDDFKTVAERNCAAWLKNPAITLIWTTQAEMQALYDNYAEDLAQRKAAGGDRPSITSLLEQQNAEMDAAVTEVKVYIEKKFKKKTAKPQFSRYGIIKSHGAYILPRDQDKRLQNLDLMIEAIAKDGFGEEEYGTEFWMNMKKGFENLLSSAYNTDGTVSGKVSAKNTARQELEKIMTALRTVLRGNYPDTYASVYREWGWKK